MLYIPEVKRTQRSSREKLQLVGDIQKNVLKEMVFEVDFKSGKFIDYDRVRRIT